MWLSWSSLSSKKTRFSAVHLAPGLPAISKYNQTCLASASCPNHFIFGGLAGGSSLAVTVAVLIGVGGATTEFRVIVVVVFAALSSTRSFAGVFCSFFGFSVCSSVEWMVKCFPMYTSISRSMLASFSKSIGRPVCRASAFSRSAGHKQSAISNFCDFAFQLTSAKET